VRDLSHTWTFCISSGDEIGIDAHFQSVGMLVYRCRQRDWQKRKKILKKEQADSSRKESKTSEHCFDHTFSALLSIPSRDRLLSALEVVVVIVVIVAIVVVVVVI
jgi:hypothetical protein